MIEVVELHISNKCTADCVVCSKAHGGHNTPYMTAKVMQAAIYRIKQLPNKPKIELGGDGDAFLHWQFGYFMDLLKRELPDHVKELFTNGYLLTSGWTNRIIRGKLIDRIEIRLDSLNKDVYRAATGMELAPVIMNISHFATENARAGKPVQFGVLYLPLYKYARFCREVLNKEPTYFSRVEEFTLVDEYSDVVNFALDLGISSRITGISLWAERTDCLPNYEQQCPRLPENFPGDMARQIYVYPNGDIGLCGYDDGQDTFILGNVLTHRFQDVWESSVMQKYIQAIRDKDPALKCCVDPQACVMWEYNMDGGPVDPAELHGRS